MTNTDTFVINSNALTKQYRGVNVLNNLNLTVPKNSIFGFLGPNGAGKSTTIKLMLGLIRPTSGKATIFGQDIVQNSVEIRQRVGYLAQEPRFYEHMSARQTLRYTARFFYKGPKKRIDDRVGEMLELVGLGGKADRPIKGFSGGERQRLGIAQAQINYPDLLILDEPAASLDPMGRHDVLAVMEKLRQHTTIFYSTHILEDVQRVSDRVAILNHGELVAEAPIQQLLAGTANQTTYVFTIKGDPYPVPARLNALSWVEGITTEPLKPEGQTTFNVSVSDASQAEDTLLRYVLTDSGITVTAFGRKTYNLEEIFLNLIEGNNKKNGK